MESVYTIGVYGFDAESFQDALQSAEIDLLIDLRRRRGVRGREYAFANSKRLQESLSKRGIRYEHVLALAPDQETRALQSVADARDRVARRKRDTLSAEFVADYEQRVLGPYNWSELDAVVGDARRPVFLCVERLPTACHRRLAAHEFAKRHKILVVDLLP
jgi:uncharacterized protein (DUF488 family)